MKHPFLLWLALLFSLLTATSHATHLKGGSLTWEPVSSTSTTFSVRAKVLLNYDSSDTGITGATGPEVKGKKTYLVNDVVAVSVGSTKLYWGDEDPNAPGNTGLELEGSNSRFRVVRVDEAAQIVTVEPYPLDPSVLVHEYTGSEGDFHVMNIQANARDDEEVLNRSGTMRLESELKLAFADPFENSPPVFTFDDVDNPVVVLQSTTATFEVPVAVDPDNATAATDEITYRFVDSEGQATEGSTDEDSWEEGAGLTIAKDPVDGKWKVSWDTSEIDQTVRTHAFQVVAEDRPAGDPGSPAKSKATIEFQVWINDPNQNGVPEIAVAPNFSTLTAVPGSPVEFRIIGTDVNEEGQLENSRLKLMFDPGELPPGAVITPTGGFAGDSGGGHHGENGRMVSVFSWTPLPAHVNTQHVMHFKVEDEDTHQSTEKTVAINVVSGTGPAALQLAVTNGTDDGHHIIMEGEPGEAMTFTVTGSCATSGVDLLLYTEDELPGDAGMTPALPASGTGSAASVFTWTPGEADLTTPSSPHEITYIVGDEYGREVVKTVLIYVYPDLPTIELAAGEPTSIIASPWQSASFRFNVTGGYGSSPWLTVEPLDAGTVDETSVESPHTGTFTWRILPGQVPAGNLRIRVTDYLGRSAILTVPVTISNVTAPDWWGDENVLTGGAARDHGMANQGQLKAITKAAYDALEAEYPDLATATPEGEDFFNFVGSFSTTSGNYVPVSQGQVKNAANVVYRAIEAVTGKDNIGVPWTRPWEDDQHSAPANVGQIKTVFSFPLPAGDLFNDPPSVTLTSPLPNAVHDDLDTVAIAATATDPDGSVASVAFYANATLLTTDTATPYEYDWSGMEVGNHVIKAVVTDDRGATRETSVPIIVNEWANSPPDVVTITSPTSGQNIPTPAYPTINVTASDPDGPIDRVVFYYNGELLGEDTSSPYSMPLTSMIVAPGSHTVSVVAWDTHGGWTPASVTFNVTAPASGATATIQLRHGVNGYTGTSDTYVMANLPSDTRGTSSYITMDNNPDQGGLIRWDTSLIPTNAIVTDADLTFYVGYNGHTLRDFEIYAMKRPWDEITATWEMASATSSWGLPGMQSTLSDRDNVVLGTVSGPSQETAIGVNLNSSGIAKVQEWVNNPSSNHGFTIQHYANGGTATRPLSLYTRHAANDFKRPMLTIKYRFP